MPGDILDAIDGALRDNTVSGDAMRWTPDPAAVGRGAEPAVVMRVTVDVSGFTEAMRLTAEAMVRFGALVWKAMGQFLPLAPCVLGHDRPRDRHRCRKCNPRGNPAPLAIDGSEYQRRLRNRRRRGR